MDADSPTSTALPTPPATWQVWRIDDNANTFLVREHLTRDEAERLVLEFTSRGHKQTYWTERGVSPKSI